VLNIPGLAAAPHKSVSDIGSLAEPEILNKMFRVYFLDCIMYCIAVTQWGVDLVGLKRNFRTLFFFDVLTLLVGSFAP